MGTTHTSARGKAVDMGAIKTKNEHVRAVGNQNVNARGDIIDSHGNVIKDANKRVNEYYMKGVAKTIPRPSTSTQPAPGSTQSEINRHEEAIRSQSKVQMPKADSKAKLNKVELTKEEMEFDAEDEIIELPKKSNSTK
jgi:hypothetical protein